MKLSLKNPSIICKLKGRWKKCLRLSSMCIDGCHKKATRLLSARVEELAKELSWQSDCWHRQTATGPGGLPGERNLRHTGYESCSSYLWSGIVSKCFFGELAFGASSEMWSTGMNHSEYEGFIGGTKELLISKLS